MITAADYMRMLLKYCKPWWRKLIFIIKSDWTDIFYYGVTRRTLEEFLDYWKREWLSQLEYVSERFDCDDFALLFKMLFIWRTGGNAMLAVAVDVWEGERLLGRHLCNCVYLEDEQKVVFIEPQTAEILCEVDGKIMTCEGWVYRLEYVEA